jgi:uncharacterized protein YcbK (DUF882 family)
MKKYLVLFILSLCAACAGNSHAASSGQWLATGGPKTSPDRIPSRSIVLLQPESGERLSVTYFHDGRYDQRILSQINYLFRDRRQGVVGVIDPELIDFLVDIRTRLDLPPTVVFEILSGYRTAESNAILARSNSNVAIESLHVHGWAVDFRIPGVDGRAIAEVAKTMQRGGVAFYPNSNHVHIDLGNIRTWHEKSP